jgi:hypothetical protein
VIVRFVDIGGNVDHHVAALWDNEPGETLPVPVKVILMVQFK